MVAGGATAGTSTVTLSPGIEPPGFCGGGPPPAAAVCTAVNIATVAAGPGSPCGPCGPVAPAGPCSPGSPCGPCGPDGPVGPSGPTGVTSTSGPLLVKVVSLLSSVIRTGSAALGTSAMPKLEIDPSSQPWTSGVMSTVRKSPWSAIETIAEPTDGPMGGALAAESEASSHGPRTGSISNGPGSATALT